MTRLNRLFLMVFLQSFATILVERGVYFYTKERLSFSETKNLALALLLGLVYVAGALVSHPLSERFGQRRLLRAAYLTHLLSHLGLFFLPQTACIIGLSTLAQAMAGLQWPLVESFACAGLTPTQTLGVTGKYNLSWSTAVPLSLLVTGPIVAAPATAPYLFLLAALTNAVAVWLTRGLEAQPVHLHVDHPQRVSAATAQRLSRLLLSSRLAMVVSYVLLFLLAPLMPDIYGRLAIVASIAAALSAFLDVPRILAFEVLRRWDGWHQKRSPLVAAIFAMPVGFLLILAGDAWGSLAAVLAGELIFGAGAGLAYHTALYYAMVLKSASVDAGGAHESLIGSGLALGPAVGLVGMFLAPKLGSPVLGLLAAAGPLLLLCSAAALWPLLHRQWQTQQPAPQSEPEPAAQET